MQMHLKTHENQTVDRISAMVEDAHLLKHPFYLAWNAGTLTFDALRDYATQYYRHVAAFPTYLSGVHAQSDDLEVRRVILRNLIDEEGGSSNHPELWMQFVERLGLSRRDLLNAPVWPETAHLISEFREVCSRSGVASGLAALYAYESQISAVSEAKIEGLERFYGFVTSADSAYFQVHIEADREHSAVERKILQDILTDENEPAALEAVRKVLSSLNGLLSAVLDRHPNCAVN
jgi:pyrroloquinoline-quinone synthase